MRNYALRGCAADQGGFTLVELLVAMVASVTLLTAVFVLLESSQLVQARDSEWALTLQEDRQGLARMMRDIRSATKVEEATAGKLLFSAMLGNKEWQVKYECALGQSGTTYTECARFAAEKGKALPGNGQRVARDITNGSSVFTYSPTTAEPKLVTVTLKVPAKGLLKQAGSSGYGHEVVLEDAAFMRNLYPEG